MTWLRTEIAQLEKKEKSRRRTAGHVEQVLPAAPPAAASTPGPPFEGAEPNVAPLPRRVPLRAAVAKDVVFPWLGFSGRSSLPSFVLQSGSSLPLAGGRSSEERPKSTDVQDAPNFPEPDPDPLLSIPGYVAEFLLENYISRVMPIYPIFHEPWLRGCHARVIHGQLPDHDHDHEHKAYDVYTVSLVMAMSLSTAARSQQARANSIAFRLFQHATKYIDRIFTNDFRGLQAVVLLHTYVAMNPAAANMYLLDNYMIQACIDLGLHREPPDQNDTDLLERDLKRRVFWSAWTLDVSCSAVFTRPPALLAKDITTGPPSDREDAAIHRTHIDPRGRRSKFMFGHVRTYRLITAEIMSVLCHGHPVPSEFGSLEAWQEATEARIHAWRDEILGQTEANLDRTLAAPLLEMSIYCEIADPLIILALFGPCARIQRPGSRNVTKVFDASVQVARGYMRQANTGFGASKYTFHSCHHVASAAMVFLQLIRENPHTLSSLFTLDEMDDFMAAFSSFFSHGAEKWPAFSRCLDEYHRLLGPVKEGYVNHVRRSTPVSQPGSENNDSTFGVPNAFPVLGDSHVNSVFEFFGNGSLAEILPDWSPIPLDDWDKYFDFHPI
jgi:hypothetical protein